MRNEVEQLAIHPRRITISGETIDCYELSSKQSALWTALVLTCGHGHFSDKDPDYYARLFSRAPEMLSLLNQLLDERFKGLVDAADSCVKYIERSAY